MHRFQFQMRAGPLFVLQCEIYASFFSHAAHYQFAEASFIVARLATDVAAANGSQNVSAHFFSLQANLPPWELPHYCCNQDLDSFSFSTEESTSDQINGRDDRKSGRRCLNLIMRAWRWNVDSLWRKLTIKNLTGNYFAILCRSKTVTWIHSRTNVRFSLWAINVRRWTMFVVASVLGDK